MLANGSSGQFLGQSGGAALHNLGENCSDGPFRNRAKMQPRCLVIGYYGFDNVGDEWLLQKTLLWIRDQHPTAKVCALYAPQNLAKKRSAPYDSSHVLQELTYCNRFSLLDVLSALTRSTHVICGGGSLLQDHTSRRSLWYYTGLLILARLLNKKVTLLGQGFSPMKHPLSKRLLKWALNKAQISTRDHYSQTQIEPIPSVCASDLAYFHAKLHPETSLETAQKAPLIGLALHPQLPKSFKSPLMDALHQLPQDFLFLSFFPENDKTLLSEYPDILPKILDHWTPWQHKPTTRPCPTLQHHTIKWLITSRYHGAVWASLKGIPFLAIAADPKLISIAQDLGQPYIDCTPPTSSEEVYKQIQTFIHQYPILRQHLLELTPHLIKKAACHPPLR